MRRAVYGPAYVLSSAPPNSAAILVVSEVPASLADIGCALQPLTDRTVVAQNAAQALRVVTDVEIMAAVLPLDLNGTDCVGVARALRARAQKPDLPILFVAGADPDEETLQRIRELGWADFSLFPLTPEMLRFKIAVMSDSHRMSIDAAEKALTENDRKFRLFFALSSAGHAMINPQTLRYIDVNRRYSEIVGRSPEELRRLTFLDITHPDDRDQDRRLFEKFVAGESSEVTAEKRYLKPDGSVVWVHLTTTLVRDENGTPELQLTVVQDISERKKTEAQLEESQTRLRLAIEAADLGVFHHDCASGIDIWSERAKQLLGLEPYAEASMPALLQRVHPEDLPRVQSEIQKLFTQTTTAREFEIQFRVAWSDGSLHYLAANGLSRLRTTCRGAPTRHIVGTIRDITATKQFELEMRRQVEARTQELHEKTDQLENFCYTVAHDLRAPLRSISGYADIALEELGPSAAPSIISHFDRIKHSTRRMDALIRDLLTYIRMSEVSVAVEPVELAGAVDAALKELDHDIHRSGAQIEVRQPLPSVLAEKSTLDHVIANLISNAVKFTAAGTAPKVEIFAEHNGDQVRLSIRDQGIGIPAEYHERIFKMFERLQAAQNYPGTGMGLAIAAKAMARMHGRYGVESTAGSGSTFWIELQQATP